MTTDPASIAAQTGRCLEPATLTKIVCNGEPREVAPATSVAALLELLQLPTRQVAVEVNLQLVPRGRHTECLLAEGDRVEIVSLVGGG